MSYLHRYAPAAGVAWPAAAVCLLLAATAGAQNFSTEIIVTTRRIEESLREVPLAITAFDAGAIEAAGIDDLNDVAALTPGLQFYNPLGETLPVPIIRGVAPLDIRDSENNTAIFVDGVYVSGREGLNFSQLDIERIEVVKGPQSSQYGRNAFSGAINYVTKRPSDIFEARAETTLGNRGKVLGKGSISGPLVENVLAYRIGALVDEWDGSYDNSLGPQDIGGYHYNTQQASLLFTPTDDLEALFSIYASQDRIDDSATTAVPTNCENSALFDPALQEDVTNGRGPPYGSITANFCGTVPTYGKDEIPKILGANGETRDLIRAALNINWEIGVGTLSFLTGYTDTTQSAVFDFSRDLGYDNPITYFSTLNGGSLQQIRTGVLNFEAGNQTDEISQEIRFTSPQDQAFRYIFGAFYYDVSRDELSGDPILQKPGGGQLTLADLPADFIRFCPCASSPPGFAPFGDAIFMPGLSPFNPQPEISTDTNSWAVFGSAEQDFLEEDRLTARLELRYAYQEQEYRLFNANPGGPPPAPFDDNEDSKKNDWDSLTGRFSLNYKVNDRWIMYTSVATAEKSGSFDGDLVDVIGPGAVRLSDVPQIVSVDPEKNITTELGAKGVTSDGVIAIDVAVYRIDWSEMVLPEVFTSLEGFATSGSPPAFNRNIGDATIRGWELAADLRFNDAWSGRVTAAYTDAQLDSARIGSFQYWPSFRAAGCDTVPADPAEADACDAASGFVSGNQILRVSPYTFSGALSYRQAAFGDWDFYSRGDVTWRDNWFIGNDNEGIVPANTKLNLKLGLENARYTVELWMDNVLENDKPVGAYRDIYWTNTQDPLGQQPVLTSSFADFPKLRLTVNQPRLRTFGLTGRVRFGGAVK
jgi:iron complex outermembrane receptor protein